MKNALEVVFGVILLALTIGTLAEINKIKKIYNVPFKDFWVIFVLVFICYFFSVIFFTVGL